MKRLFMLLAVAATFAACNTEKKVDAIPAPAAIPLAYTPTYSSSFEIGNPEHATTIVQGSWKDWEDNNLDNMRNWVADSVVAYHSDNSVVMGLDSLMARWKKGRATYASTKPQIDAVIPVYSTDKKESWVLVWATEISTKPDGTSDTTAVMETWRINKDGKADLLYQFDRAKRKK
jgi:hypothetical protein